MPHWTVIFIRSFPLIFALPDLWSGTCKEARQYSMDKWMEGWKDVCLPVNGRMCVCPGSWQECLWELLPKAKCLCQFLNCSHGGSFQNVSLGSHSSCTLLVLWKCGVGPSWHGLSGWFLFSSPKTPEIPGTYYLID